MEAAVTARAKARTNRVDFIPSSVIYLDRPSFSRTVHSGRTSATLFETVVLDYKEREIDKVVIRRRPGRTSTDSTSSAAKRFNDVDRTGIDRHTAFAHNDGGVPNVVLEVDRSRRRYTSDISFSSSKWLARFRDICSV